MLNWLNCSQLLLAFTDTSYMPKVKGKFTPLLKLHTMDVYMEGIVWLVVNLNGVEWEVLHCSFQKSASTTYGIAILYLVAKRRHPAFVINQILAIGTVATCFTDNCCFQTGSMSGPHGFCINFFWMADTVGFRCFQYLEKIVYKVFRSCNCCALYFWEYCYNAK